MELRNVDQNNLIYNSDQTVNTPLDANLYPSAQFQNQDNNPEKLSMKIKIILLHINLLINLEMYRIFLKFLIN